MLYRQYIPHRNDDNYAFYSKELFSFTAFNSMTRTIDITDPNGVSIQRIFSPDIQYDFRAGHLILYGFVDIGKSYNDVRYRFYSEEKVKEDMDRIPESRLVKAKLIGRLYPPFDKGIK